MAQKYWRLKIQPFGGDLKGVFVSLHTTKSDIALFYRDADNNPCHRFEDNVPAATELGIAVFRRYSKETDVLLPAQGSQKPGVIIAGMRSLVEVGKRAKTWNAWNAWLKQFEHWQFEGNQKNPNPRKQYACEVRQLSNDEWSVVEMKERAW